MTLPADFAPLAVAAALLAGCGSRSGLLGADVEGTGGSSGVGGASSGALSVSAASSYACAVTLDAAVKCWGYNANGQLGNGSTKASAVPVDVVGLSADVAAVAAGAGHACALTRAGAVKCWGWNEFGQLGDGSNADSSTPVDVVGLSSGVVAIAAGNGFSCAVTTGGAAECWGATVAFTGPVPTVVSGLSHGVVAVSAGVATGDEQACVVTDGGAAKCWGSDASGELGDGDHTNKSIPVDVLALSSGVRAISAGNAYTCALTLAGAVECWGADFGQLGSPIWGGSPLPVVIPGLSSGIAAVSAGNVQACALTVGGAAKCWGQNEHGQLGNGQAVASAVPVDVVGLSSGVAQISAGSSFSCAVTTDGAVECWGANESGELGDGTTTERHVPGHVTGL